MLIGEISLRDRDPIAAKRALSRGAAIELLLLLRIRVSELRLRRVNDLLRIGIEILIDLTRADRGRASIEIRKGRLVVRLRALRILIDRANASLLLRIDRSGKLAVICLIWRQRRG